MPNTIAKHVVRRITLRSRREVHNEMNVMSSIILLTQSPAYTLDPFLCCGIIVIQGVLNVKPNKLFADTSSIYK